MPKKNPARDRHDYFVYKSSPFRPLYLGGLFHAPHNGAKLWLFRQRNVARLMASVNGAEYADFRSFVRVATGGQAFDYSKPTKTSHRKPTLEELS